MALNATDPASEMQAIVRLAAEPRPAGDSTKGAIGRAARALKLTYRRAYAFWYLSERVRVTAEEADRLRAERERLHLLRLERLRHEIAVTERLLAEARQRDAVAQAAADQIAALDRRGGGPGRALGGPLSDCAA